MAAGVREQFDLEGLVCEGSQFNLIRPTARSRRMSELNESGNDEQADLKRDLAVRWPARQKPTCGVLAPRVQLRLSKHHACAAGTA
jgi:hypothetical protein